MKSIVNARYASAIFIFALLVSSLGPADAANFAGTWGLRGTITGSRIQTSISPVCAILQSGNRIGGSCKGPNNAGPVAGAVSGALITFQWRTVPVTRLGFSGVCTFKGALRANGAITGTWTFTGNPGFAGPFTMARVR
jgi:hypothetical protein